MESFQKVVPQNDPPSATVKQVLEAAEHGSLAGFNNVCLGDTEEVVLEKLKPSRINDIGYGTKYFVYIDVQKRDIAHIVIQNGMVHKMVGFYKYPGYMSFPEDVLEYYSSDRRVRVKRYPDGSQLLLYPDLAVGTPIHLVKYNLN